MWIFLLILCGSPLIPVNYTGHALKLKTASFNPIPTEKSAENLPGISEQPTDPQSEKSSKLQQQNLVISNNFLLFSTISWLIAIGFSLFLLTYLSRQSLNKECLLLYLYQDGYKILTAWITGFYAAVIVCRTTGDGVYLGMKSGRYLTNLGQWFSIPLALNWNITNLLRLFMERYKMLDPITR